jgi:hypothetical protein
MLDMPPRSVRSKAALWSKVSPIVCNPVDQEEAAKLSLREIIDQNPILPKDIVIAPGSKSTYVVVTYWWGCGNINYNTQYPCPDDAKDAQNGINKILAIAQPALDANDTSLIPSDQLNTLYALTNITKKRDNDSPSALANRKKEVLKHTRDMIEYLQEELEIAQQIKMQPVKYQEMIERFGRVCLTAGCHYMAKEYREFAIKGGYQNAINAKPLFIKAALQAAHKAGFKGVLYIDGDMDVVKAPKVFDIPDVDVALRGWNIDARSSQKAMKTGLICHDSRIVETSGGTMYFSTSPQAFFLLDVWAKQSASLLRKGKADDRILSEIITAHDFHVRMNIIQLPIEYLWLSQAYNTYIKRMEKGALITHPYCLTGEERASELGAASNRNPITYDSLVSSQIECHVHGGIFYEQVYFDDEETAKEYKPYLDWISKTKLVKYEGEWLPAMYVVPWNKAYGKHTSTVTHNIKAYAEFETAPLVEHAPVISITTVMGEEFSNTIEVININTIGNKQLDIIRILYQLKANRHVIYHPTEKVNRRKYNRMIQHIETRKKRHVFPQFLAFSRNENMFKPDIPDNTPMFFAPSSRVLLKMLLMCRDTTKIANIFHSSDIFWSRIRCDWLEIDDDEHGSGSDTPKPFPVNGKSIMK